MMVEIVEGDIDEADAADIDVYCLLSNAETVLKATKFAKKRGRLTEEQLDSVWDIQVRLGYVLALVEDRYPQVVAPSVVHALRGFEADAASMINSNLTH